jgi:hypothetical protein
VYQTVNLINPFKKTHNNENNENNSHVHIMYTSNLPLTVQPKDNITPIAPPCYIPSIDLNEWFRAFDTYQNNVITNSKSKLMDSLLTSDVQNKLKIALAIGNYDLSTDEKAFQAIKISLQNLYGLRSKNMTRIRLDLYHRKPRENETEFQYRMALGEAVRIAYPGCDLNFINQTVNEIAEYYLNKNQNDNRALTISTQSNNTYDQQNYQNNQNNQNTNNNNQYNNNQNQAYNSRRHNSQNPNSNRQDGNQNRLIPNHNQSTHTNNDYNNIRNNNLRSNEQPTYDSNNNNSMRNSNSFHNTNVFNNPRNNDLPNFSYNDSSTNNNNTLNNINPRPFPYNYQSNAIDPNRRQSSPTQPQ